ncbi:hypothetical protein LOC54_02215 [Acetobacter sp. AN02]|uniref:hypothetical protein n=1 Tax=Acetobacter sp. AN02 TaxID=2894186 RepID=UPI0024343F40|nr:hypothetical protein [Acetobacter sp. AN02]MDG6093937.1 hypothetical protein [Acetobacter sp. AN02]
MKIPGQFSTKINSLQSIQYQRKQEYEIRRPALITILPDQAVQRFLQRGPGDFVNLSDERREAGRELAAREISRIIRLIESGPIGLQFSVLTESENSTNCVLLRGREKTMLAINPFRCDASPYISTGVSLVTSAPEAVNAHQKVVEDLWKKSIKGMEAAQYLRGLLAENGFQ